MALDPEKLDALMILVCAVALVLLIGLVIYTWVKWHQKQIQSLAFNESGPPEIAVEGIKPAAHYQRGYLNEAGRNSSNLSGSRTFLNDDVLEQKPFLKDASPPPPFETKDVVYHANAERDPQKLLAGDAAYNANARSFGQVNNKTGDAIDSSHVVFNAEEPSRTRRWTEPKAQTGEENEVEVSHRKNTYL